jgi:hypothetical protein
MDSAAVPVGAVGMCGAFFSYALHISIASIGCLLSKLHYCVFPARSAPVCDPGAKADGLHARGLPQRGWRGFTATPRRRLPMAVRCDLSGRAGSCFCDSPLRGACARGDSEGERRAKPQRAEAQRSSRSAHDQSPPAQGRDECACEARARDADGAAAPREDASEAWAMPPWV